MIPDATAAALVTEETVRDEAVNKPVTLDPPPSPSYSADGPATLTDGKLAATDDLQSGWLGFEGKDFTATVDLGKPTAIRSAGAHFLQYFGPGIFFPRSVAFEGSED